MFELSFVIVLLKKRNGMKNIFFGLTLVLFGNEITNAQNCNFICNGSFENPLVVSAPHFVDSNLMPCWRTTAANGQMELWNSGYNGVQSFSGNQFLEMNAFSFCIIYQDFIVQPNTILQIGFAHRGRAGVDSVNVSIGAVGGTYISLGDFGADTVWNYHSLNYTIPSGNDSVYTIRFNSIYATLNDPGIGNFLDTVTVCGLNVGLNETNYSESIKVYPLLFTDEIKIQLNNEKEAKFLLFDGFSRLVVQQEISNSSGIKTDHLKRGVYCYQIKTLNGILKNGKLIKQ